MNRVITTWSLSVSGEIPGDRKISFRYGPSSEQIVYNVVDIKYLRPRTWRFYSSPTDYVLAVLNDSVRIEIEPDFTIRSPDMINNFLRTNGMVVR